MARILFSFTVLLLLLAPRAQAATINLLLTTDFNNPTIGAPETGFVLRVFEAPANGWPRDTLRTPQTALLSLSTQVLPGVTQFDLSLDAESLDHIYFTLWGEYQTNPRCPCNGLYAASPPSGRVDDGLINGYGPPWISLADLGDGFGGDFQWFLGFSRGVPVGTWTLAPAPAEVSPVPEPASLILFGSGLAAVAAKKYRRSKFHRAIR